MRFYRLMAAPLAILLLSLTGCGGGGGGGGGSTPAPAGDTSAPTVSITAPANTAQVSGITTVSASAADDVAVTMVKFYLNGTTLMATSTSAPYSFNWDTSSLPRGSYTLSAKAFDAAGNIGQSANVVVTVPITVSMTTAISGSTAVGTVSLAGLSSPEAFALNLTVTMPASATIASANPSGVAASAFSPDVNGSIVILPSTSGFGSGEVLRILFDNVPAGAVPADFGVSLSAAFGAGGVQIQ
jgi:hypothetical protein